MSNGRVFIIIFFILTFFTLMNFLRMLDRPALANIRSVDVLYLIGTGMCLGGAIVAFVAYYRSRRSS